MLGALFLSSLATAALAADTWVVKDAEVLDCFTSERHFRFCCCNDTDSRHVCWAGAGEGPAAMSRARCCTHLMEYCQAEMTDDSNYSAGECSSSNPQCVDDQLHLPKPELEVNSENRRNERAREAAIAASDAAKAIIGGQASRAEQCSLMHVYSPKHCCDRRFEPPNSRCFDSLEVFEACCQGGGTSTEQW
eukprot:gb/GFBE01021552.1/.p1 GENE.gb/GFBE01021552.1/~~gb/GFBE01021552.1/.p1  ORF type:complete len:191 (+),score=31.08 gb/GFBE01021552.1/:1-573(+)